MADIKVKCIHCAAELECPGELAGQEVACPNCGKSLLIRPPRRPLRAPVPSPQAPVPASAGEGAFPERMKANRALLGRTCTSCGQSIELGQDVFNCPSCQQTMHLACKEQAGGCTNTACSSAASVQANTADGTPVPSAATGTQQDEMVECKHCRELIRKGARKCRHCGELQGAAARAAAARKKRQEQEDSTLTTGEIVFGIICAGIACILGLIWGIQGKKKGWKLVGISLLAQAVWTVLQLMAGLQ